MPSTPEFVAGGHPATYPHARSDAGAQGRLGDVGPRRQGVEAGGSVGPGARMDRRRGRPRLSERPCTGYGRRSARATAAAWARRSAACSSASSWRIWISAWRWCSSAAGSTPRSASSTARRASVWLARGGGDGREVALVGAGLQLGGLLAQGLHRVGRVFDLVGVEAPLDGQRERRGRDCLVGGAAAADQHELDMLVAGDGPRAVARPRRVVARRSGGSAPRSPPRCGARARRPTTSTARWRRRSRGTAARRGSLRRCAGIAGHGPGEPRAEAGEREQPERARDAGGPLAASKSSTASCARPRGRRGRSPVARMSVRRSQARSGSAASAASV